MCELQYASVTASGLPEDTASETFAQWCMTLGLAHCAGILSLADIHNSSSVASIWSKFGGDDTVMQAVL